MLLRAILTPTTSAEIILQNVKDRVTVGAMGAGALICAQTLALLPNVSVESCLERTSQGERRSVKTCQY